MNTNTPPSRAEEPLRLLIVEDEGDLSAHIARYLHESAGHYRCTQAHTYAEAMRLVATECYACVVLDLMLPDGSGLNVLRRIRRLHAAATGVIVTSARQTLADKVGALQLGADDYLPKPFHPAELSARVMALMRRLHPAPGEAPGLLRSGRLLLDTAGKQAYTLTPQGRRQPLCLTKTEFELLHFLVENAHRILPNDILAAHLSARTAPNPAGGHYNFVYLHIKNLKAKLARAGLTQAIQNVYGAGYRWREKG